MYMNSNKCSWVCKQYSRVSQNVSHFEKFNYSFCSWIRINVQGFFFIFTVLQNSHGGPTNRSGGWPWRGHTQTRVSWRRDDMVGGHWSATGYIWPNFRLLPNKIPVTLATSRHSMGVLFSEHFYWCSPLQSLLPYPLLTSRLSVSRRKERSQPDPRRPPPPQPPSWASRYISGRVSISWCLLLR